MLIRNRFRKKPEANVPVKRERKKGYPFFQFLYELPKNCVYYNTVFVICKVILLFSALLTFFEIHFWE